MNRRDILSIIAAVFVAGVLAGTKLATPAPTSPHDPAPGEIVIEPGGGIWAGDGEIRVCGPDALIRVDGEHSKIERVSMRGMDDVRSAISVR